MTPQDWLMLSEDCRYHVACKLAEDHRPAGGKWTDEGRKEAVLIEMGNAAKVIDDLSHMELLELIGEVLSTRAEVTP